MVRLAYLRVWEMLLGVYKQCAVWLVAIALLLSGCTRSSSVIQGTSSEETCIPQEVNADFDINDFALPKLLGNATVELTVKGQPIVVEIDGNKAPITAGNFLDLIERGVYDGTTFHRVVREPTPFVVQGGSPESKDPSVSIDRLMSGGFIDPETNQSRSIPLEIMPADADKAVYNQTFEEACINQRPALPHTRGAIAMARSQYPLESASSQFYIVLADQPPLDGEYAVFGYVTEGMDVVDEIQLGDVLESVRIVNGLENLQIPDPTLP
jgi:peptidyl-prolyl cis-trans isomerase B (cyclophilin B)